MRAIVFNQRNNVTLQERPDPKPGAGEVLVEVQASGICGTDVEILHGNYGTSAYPLIPGHEYAGTIIEIGDEYEELFIEKGGQKLDYVPSLNSNDSWVKCIVNIVRGL